MARSFAQIEEDHRRGSFIVCGANNCEIKDKKQILPKNRCGGCGRSFGTKPAKQSSARAQPLPTMTFERPNFFGPAVERYMDIRTMTKEEVCVRSGITRVVLGTILDGRVALSPDLVRRFAKTFRVKPEDFEQAATLGVIASLEKEPERVS